MQEWKLLRKQQPSPASPHQGQETWTPSSANGFCRRGGAGDQTAFTAGPLRSSGWHSTRAIPVPALVLGCFTWVWTSLKILPLPAEGIIAILLWKITWHSAGSPLNPCPCIHPSEWSQRQWQLPKVLGIPMWTYMELRKFQIRIL